jgi:N-glycosylase/DNA lyase
MRIDWSVEERDVCEIRELLTAANENRFVVRRGQDNVSGPAPRFCREEFWRVMLGCLLTTQQRSGPGTSVSRFLRSDPFPLAYARLSLETAEAAIRDVLSEFGGLRFAPTIAERGAENFRWLESGGWTQIEGRFGQLLTQRSTLPSVDHVAEERNAAVFIAAELKGFGPKQARNLWQWLGLARYEIPLDSRITRWLNESVFPFRLSATALADENYYAFVMNGVQELCSAAGVLPCIFDAAVFARYDRDWEPDELDY